MFPTKEDATRRMEDLRRQRAQLDAELADLEQFLALGERLAWIARLPPAGASDAPREDDSAASRAGSPPSPAAPAGPESAGDGGAAARAEARRQGRAQMAAVEQVLRKAGRPMHVGEIHRALAARGLALPGPAAVAALNTRLWKRAQGGRVVAQAGPEATYRLLDAADPGA